MITVKKRHRFFENQDGGSRHVGFRLTGFLNIIDVLQVKCRNIPTKFSAAWSKINERLQFIEIQDSGNRQVGFRFPGISRYHRYVALLSRNNPTKFGEL